MADFYHKLGDSGLNVSKVIVGCMSFGLKGWAEWVIEDEEKVMLILKKCYDSGLRTYDTANVYSNGQSEILVGKFLKKYNIARETVVILSKVYFPVNNEDPNVRLLPDMATLYHYMNAQGLSRKHILDSAKASVERLGTYMDVLQIHRLDKSTPKHEIMRALNDAVLEGYTRYIGASSMRATEFAELQYVADKNGWFKFISMQNYYNLLYREEEREMIPYCNDNILGKVGCIPWSPIARGLLARPVNSESEHNRNNNTDIMIGKLTNSELKADAEIISRVEKVAKKLGVSMANVATAWVVSKGHTPIVGINTLERVDDTINALSLKLSDEDIKYLEEPYIPRAVFGHA